MQTTTHAVGIDLGTTYSCIAYLNEHGEPVTLANQEGELATPSVVLFDGDEPIVGTEALRNAIAQPDNVVQNSKRFIGDMSHSWKISGRTYNPVDIASLILKKLISGAQEQIGAIDQAVITVPAQFSDYQRHSTMQAGINAGLKQVDIINEPVAAALCYVLGTEGLWFSELANEQRILVYDLGGGTFDLSLVRYQKNEVGVIKSAGDLHLGGIDWSKSLVDAIANQFKKEFNVDPREDSESKQFLYNEAEQTKRSLTVRPRAALTCQHGGNRKTYQVQQTQFEKLTKSLVDRTVKITEDMLRDEKGKVRWGQVDVVLTTGGSSRMPMVRNKLKELSGTTINTSLSPDQSIAHGATYYAGMLLSNNKFAKSILNEKATSRLSTVKQQSVNARALGIMVRDMEKNKRLPHYMLPENTPLPAEFTQIYGTVKEDQRRVKLEIVESPTAKDQTPAVLGACVIDNLPPNLPEGSEIAVTISYDAQAIVHVSAKDVTSGKVATADIIRQENVLKQIQKFEDKEPGADVAIVDSKKGRTAQHQQQRVKQPAPKPRATKPQTAPPSNRGPQKQPAPQQRAVSRTAEKKPSVRPAPKPRAVPPAGQSLESAARPVPLCNKCGELLDARGRCSKCAQNSKSASSRQSSQQQRKKTTNRSSQQQQKKRVARKTPPNSGSPSLPPVNDSEILDLNATSKQQTPPRRKKKVVKKRVKKKHPNSSTNDQVSAGEEEFWQE